MVSTMANWESNPNVNNIAKNKNDQNGAARKKNKVKHLAFQEVIFINFLIPGNLVTKSGYATKANPVPGVAISSIGAFNSLAIKPKTENMAKPATKEVRQLPKQTIIVSLQINN